MATDKDTQPAEIEVSFSLTQINEILTKLGEIPAKYSLDLIAVIRNKAQEQVDLAAQEAAKNNSKG